jgi:hypothetical protein
MLKSVAEITHRKGLVLSPEVESLPVDETEELLSYARYIIGANSRGMSIRGKKLLGWKPSKSSFEDEIENAVDLEAGLLGLV